MAGLEELALEGMQEAGPLECKPWLRVHPVFNPVAMVPSWVPNHVFIVVCSAEVRHAGAGAGDLVTRVGGNVDIQLAVDHRRRTLWAFQRRGPRTKVLKMREAEGGGWCTTRKEVEYAFRYVAGSARGDGAVLAKLAGHCTDLHWYHPETDRLGGTVQIARFAQYNENAFLPMAVVVGDEAAGFLLSRLTPVMPALLSVCRASSTPYRFFHKLSNAAHTVDHVGHLLAVEGRPSGTLWMFRDGQVTRHRVCCRSLFSTRAPICVLHSGHVAVCHAGTIMLVGPVPGVVPPPLPLWSPRAHRRYASSLHRFVAMVLMCADRAAAGTAAPLPRLAFVHWERILTFLPMNHMLLME